jgi:SAM-dependent methyltransferase
MAAKIEIYEAAREISKTKTALYEELAHDPEFNRRGGKIYPYDTIGANLDAIFSLLEVSGNESLLTGDHVSRVADIGCANGELSLVLSKAGYQVLALDYSFQHDQAPYVVSWISRRLGLPLTVVDTSIDCQFDIVIVRGGIVFDTNGVLLSAKEPFALTICVGLLYHLKNPFSFMQSLAEMTSYCVLGTHLFTHLPGDDVPEIGKWPLVYLLGERELNHDPTNYWIFSDTAMMRLVERSGFNIIEKEFRSNNPEGVGRPDRTDKGLRGFYLLRSTRFGPA